MRPVLSPQRKQETSLACAAGSETLLLPELHAHVHAGIARTVFDVDVRDAEAIDQLNELIELAPRRRRLKRLAQDELRQEEILIRAQDVGAAGGIKAHARRRRARLGRRLLRPNVDQLAALLH